VVYLSRIHFLKKNRGLNTIWFSNFALVAILILIKKIKFSP